MSKLRDAAQAVVSLWQRGGIEVPDGTHATGLLLRLEAVLSEPDGDASMPVATGTDGLPPLPMPDKTYADHSYPAYSAASVRAYGTMVAATRDAEIAEAVKQDQAQAVEVLLMRDAEIERLRLQIELLRGERAELATMVFVLGRQTRCNLAPIQGVEP